MQKTDVGGEFSPALEANAAPLWKRALDLTVLVVALPVILPVMATIAVGIYLISPGAVIFRQERVGLHGRRFTCFKFRSMVAAADTRDHQHHTEFLLKSGSPMTKMDASGDSRLIPFGSLLRATGMDELPQLWNVVRGEMSLIGPRPCIPYEYELYEEHQKRRFETVPGITGLWQVSGKNKTTFNEMIDMDVFYARNKTLLMDLQIMFRTLPAVLVQTWEWLKKRQQRNSKPANSKSQNCSRGVMADLN